MNFQTVITHLKELLPVERLLVGARWLSFGLLAATIGNFAAGIFEAHFLTVPFESSRYVPLLETKKELRMSIEEFEPIITHNAFNAEISDEDLSVKEELVPTKPGSNLKQVLSNLQLVGISVLQGRYAVCIIQDIREKTEEIFGIDDTVFNTGAVVRKIIAHGGEQKVYLQLNEEIGVLTYTEDPVARNREIARQDDSSRDRSQQPESPSSSSYSGDGQNFHITSAEVEANLNDFAKLLNQARMVPYFRRGKHQGYQVKAIDKGSLYEKLGLKNQDIIEEINGEPLDSMEKVMGLFQKFRNEREFTIKLNRKGSSQYMNYYID